MLGQQGHRSMLWLGASYGWTVVSGVVAFTIRAARTSTIPHIHETLFQFSHHVVFLGGSLVVVVLVVATTELSWRASKKKIGRGMVTTILASLLIAFSILGFIVGVLSVGVVGLFALLSATPVKRSTMAVSDSGA
jgi:hypothetical protein